MTMNKVITVALVSIYLCSPHLGQTIKQTVLNRKEPETNISNTS